MGLALKDGVLGLARREHSRACARGAFSGLRLAAFSGLRGERILGLARGEHCRACAGRKHSRACARSEHPGACAESEHPGASAVREPSQAFAGKRHSRAGARGAFSGLRREACAGRAFSGLRGILGPARGSILGLAGGEHSRACSGEGILGLARERDHSRANACEGGSILGLARVRGEHSPAYARARGTFSGLRAEKINI